MKIANLTAFFLICMVFLSGCINVDVSQTLKRNGNYDLTFRLTLPEEYAGSIGDLKDSFAVDQSLNNKVKASVNGNSLSLYFHDLNFERDKGIFTDIAPAKINEDNEIDFNLSITDPSNYEYKKEFKFPVYIYTFSYTQTKKEAKRSGDLNWSSHIDDDKGALAEETRSKALVGFESVFARSDVEGLIWITADSNKSRWMKSRQVFLDNFTFGNNGDKYFLLSISPTNPAYCHIESNLFFDFAFFGNISHFSSEFSTECKSDLNLAVRNATGKIEKYFLENNLDTSKMDALGIGLIAINYTVQTFGNIADTNGEKIAKNRVRFEVYPSEEMRYYIIFTESVFSIYGPWIILAICIVVGLYFLPPIVKLIPKQKKKKDIKYPLSIDQRISEYVTKSREYGMPDAKIRQNLIMAGWKAKDVDYALSIRH